MGIPYPIRIGDFFDSLLLFSTRRGTMSTAYVFGGKSMLLNTCAAQFFYNNYYFFIRKR